MVITCAICESRFEAKRSTAKYCSDRCRQRSKRRTDASPPDDDGADRRSELLAQVRKELGDLNKLDTVDGQLAVELAIQITTPGMTGVAGLSKELRSVRAQIRMTAPQPGPTPSPKDMIALAREKREQKARQAKAR